MAVRAPLYITPVLALCVGMGSVMRKAPKPNPLLLRRRDLISSQQDNFATAAIDIFTEMIKMA